MLSRRGNAVGGNAVTGYSFLVFSPAGHVNEMSSLSPHFPAAFPSPHRDAKRGCSSGTKRMRLLRGCTATVLSQ